MSDSHSGHHHPDASCVDLAERISEFIDGELPPELRSQVEAHLHACSNCVKFVESLRRTRDVAALLPPADLPADRLRAISGRAQRELEGESGSR